MRIVFLTVIFALGISILAAQVRPLPNAHAHNDYEHERPLFDALAQGFTSVEADVHLIEGELYVAHDRPKLLSADQTLAALYLQPLLEIGKTNDGYVYPGYKEPFYLMIDIKTDAEQTYAVLKRQLETYASLLRIYEGDRLVSDGPVVVFLSGNRPMETVRTESRRMVALDGRPEDIGRGFSAEAMPVVSQRYGKILQWRGKGKIPKKQWKSLKQLADAAEREGKKLRLWASPEDPKVWETMLKAGADLINTDELTTLRKFLENR
jgi:hypothetical protein